MAFRSFIYYQEKIKKACRKHYCFPRAGFLQAEIRGLFIGMLVFECHRRLVAHICCTEVLYGSGIDVACVERPFVAFCGEFLERFAVEAYECFLYHGFVLGVAAFIIIVIGMPPAIHCTAGFTRLRIDDM